MFKIFKKIIKRMLGMGALVKIIIVRDCKMLTYRDMQRLSYFNKKIFSHYKKTYITNNLANLKKKEKINIGFVTYTPSMWSLEKFYNEMYLNERYNVCIIVARLKSKSFSSMEKTYKETVSYFLNNGKNYVEASDIEDMGQYDILFYMTPYELYESNVSVANINLKTLLCYVSYSFMLSDKKEKFNLPLYYLSWVYFCDSSFYKQMVERGSRVYTNNMVYCGFPRMDEFYEKKESSAINSGDKKVIIYAPHHSLLNDRIPYATFDQNYKQIYELAKKYKETTFWVYKPHPLLGSHSVSAGIFHTMEEYEAYVQLWRDLDNAEVCDTGTYIEVFMKSDAMVTDSVSFLAEYQYIKKPLLLLKNEGAFYNEFGNEILSILYTCPGNAYSFIEEFVVNVIKENDPMRDLRESFFETNLDYYKQNKKLANDYIYEFIERELALVNEK